MLGRAIAQRANSLAGKWNPGKLSPTLHLDANDVARITAANNAVSSWVSKTNNINFVQETTAAKPRLTGVNTLENIFAPSPATSTAGYVQANVAVDAVNAAEWDNKFTTAVTFGDNSVNRYLYVERTLGALSYVVSAYVRMDDGSAPVVTSGGSGDFLFSGGASYRASGSVLNLGGGLYRVTSVAFSGNAANAQYGVVKLTSNSAKTFKVQGFQVRSALADAEYLATATTQHRGVNGRPVVQFDGNDYMTSSVLGSALMTLSTKTFAVVFRPALLNTTQLLYSQSSGQYSSYFVASSGSRSAFANYSSALESVYSSIAAGSVYVAICEHKNGYLYQEINGVESAPVASADTNRLSGSMVLGSLNGGASPFFGDMCEMLFFNRILETHEKEKLRDYLNRKWRGI